MRAGAPRPGGGRQAGAGTGANTHGTGAAARGGGTGYGVVSYIALWGKQILQAVTALKKHLFPLPQSPTLPVGSGGLRPRSAPVIRSPLKSSDGEIPAGCLPGRGKSLCPWICAALKPARETLCVAKDSSDN